MLNILLAMAVAPGIAISLFIYWKDRHEKEPLHLLVKCFLLGALSLIPALLLEITARHLGYGEPPPGSDSGPNAVYAFLVVAASEELCKFAVLMLYAYRNKNFNEPFDGIVYAVMISMGFATLENLLYVIGGGFAVAVIRMFLSVPAHAIFAILMGYYVGLAKFKHQAFSLQMLGLAAAILFHGAFDFFLFMNHVPLLALGALFSLIVGALLSLKAIHIHAHNSPFKKTKVV